MGVYFGGIGENVIYLLCGRYLLGTRWLKDDNNGNLG